MHIRQPVPADTLGNMSGTALVTGSTGLIGNAIVRGLVDRGTPVRALVRDLERARPMLPDGVELVVGDVTAPATLAAAVDGAHVVFHAAGLPEQFLRDERKFTAVNVDGTRHLLAAAHQAGVHRVVHTSTMDVFGAPRGGTLVETRPDPDPKPSAYERSKVTAERVVDEFLDRGLDVVVVNPSATFGRSPVLSGLNVFFVRMLDGKMPMVPPGGLSVVEADNLAGAHIAAAHKGRTGERYLVADGHVTNAELAELVAQVSGAKVPRRAPEALLKAVAHTTEPLARLLRFRPMLTTGELAFILWNVRIDTSKAQAELGFTPLPVAEGVRRTVEWLRSEHPQVSGG